MKLHHIGIAVRSISEAAESMSLLYADQIVDASETVFDPLQEANLKLFEFSDGSRIELVAGKPAESVLARGLNFHHTCYEVSDLHATVEFWQKNGGVVVVPPRPAVLFGGRLVAFVMNSLGLFEFLDETDNRHLQ